MKRFSGAICVLFVVCMISTPFLVTIDASFAPAQTTPTFTGELLPDPYFAEEPDVEIGGFSPEFGYEYTPGSVALIWMHSAGYQLDYSGYYPSSGCLEYARVTQTFASSHNESIRSVKLSASIRIDCTGDFATEEIPDNLWAVNFGLHNQYGGSSNVRIISDLKNGDNEEIEFMLTDLETAAYFYGPEVEQERGLSLQLIPSALFGQTIGDMIPWMEYSGSVILTITHISFEIMLEGDSRAPPLKSPKYNTTLLENETVSLISGIESAGYDQLYEFRLSSEYEPFIGTINELSIFSLFSNHQVIRNQTVYRSDQFSYYLGISSFAFSNERFVMTSMSINESGYYVKIQCLNSYGNFFWNSTVKLYYEDIPLASIIDASGNVYVYMLSLHSAIYDMYEEIIVNSLVKIDNLGNKIWNKTLRTQNYWEYISSLGTILTPSGFGCVGNDIFISFDDELIKFDTNGEQIWNRTHPQDAMCVDPQGGLYTFARVHGIISELARWDINGNIAWTRSLGWDYGNGWMEYPYLRTMSAEANGLIHLILEYGSIHNCAVLIRVSSAGDLLSQDTIFEADRSDVYSGYEYLPFITDIAITGDGLVHIVGAYTYGGIPFSPFLTLPGTFLITYELPPLPTISPVSLTMVGIASVLLIGIAYDFFFRRGRGVPEPPAEPSIADFEW